MQEYNKQLKILVDYFKNQEKKKEDYMIGIEFEHFIIHKESLRAVTYYEAGGVEDTLKKLLDKKWKGKYEGDHLLGLSKDGKTITLEPGSQLELSVGPYKEISRVEREYLSFLEDIVPILEEKSQAIVAIGYQPENKISDIPFIPKTRYKYMSEYFKSKGKLAHNMMKGTASLQVTLDYSCEDDYIRKFRVANALSPIISAIYDNGPFFEGNMWDENSVRTRIWSNCDPDRCGVVKGALKLNNKFSYEKYADYILNTPPILVDDGNTVSFTGDKLYKEIFDINRYTIEEIEHVLTMVFPDVRTKKFIEIRMADSIPYPLNLSAIALLKGLLYDEKNLEELFKYFKDIKDEDIVIAKKDVIEKGLDGSLKEESIHEIGTMILKMAENGLSLEEKKYLKPLEDLLINKKTPSTITKEKLKLGKKAALNWCVLNNIVKR